MLSKQKDNNPEFYMSGNYIKANDHIKAEINALVNEFESKGFDTWPEWRTGKSKVFTLKTDNNVKKVGFDNVATVHCMSNRLKVEIYYGVCEKHYYDFSSINENIDLFEDVKYNYQHSIGKRLNI